MHTDFERKETLARAHPNVSFSLAAFPEDMNAVFAHCVATLAWLLGKQPFTSYNWGVTAEPGKRIQSYCLPGRDGLFGHVNLIILFSAVDCQVTADLEARLIDCYHDRYGCTNKLAGKYKGIHHFKDYPPHFVYLAHS